jgi:single-strand DNA-binding protein
MSNGVNKLILIGNLTRDPEFKVVGESAVCNFAVATNDVWFNKAGEKQEEVEFHDIVVWGNQADACNTYLSKGSPVYVEGKLKTRNWDNAEGVKQYRTEVKAQNVQFLSTGGKREEEQDTRGGGNGRRTRNR